MERTDKAIDETEDQKSAEKRKLPASESYHSKSMKRVFSEIEEKGKRPMSEFYDLKPIMPIFSNLERGGTSENELKEEDDNYDYDQDLAILKSIYHYCFNHGGIIPYPYSEKFIDYIEDSIPNLKFRGQALVSKIVKLENHFLTVSEMTAGARYYPEIIHPVYREILYLSVGLWGNREDYHVVDVIMRNKEQEKLKEVKKGKRPMSELYELKPILPTFSYLERGGTSENELKKEENYDYDQDLAILKSMYHYTSNHGGVIPYPISEELINYIEALVPDLKFRGQVLVNKILMLKSNFLAIWKMAGYYHYPEINHPVYREFFDLSMILWTNFRDYYPIDNVDVNEKHVHLMRI